MLAHGVSRGYTSALHTLSPRGATLILDTLSRTSRFHSKRAAWTSPTYPAHHSDFRIRRKQARAGTPPHATPRASYMSEETSESGSVPGASAHPSTRGLKDSRALSGCYLTGSCHCRLPVPYAVLAPSDPRWLLLCADLEKNPVLRKHEITKRSHLRVSITFFQQPMQQGPCSTAEKKESAQLSSPMLGKETNR